MEDRQQILRMLQSRYEEDRLQGLKGLARCEAEFSLASVYKALGDESWRVRKEAVQFFLSLPRSGEYVGEVIGFLHSQDNAGLRNAALEILTYLGQQAVPFLLKELSCSDSDVRKFVLDILGDIGDKSCVQSILHALADSNDNVRTAAAENLGKLGAAEAVPALLDALAIPDLSFRFTILEALGQIGAAVSVAKLLSFKEERLLRKALFDCLGRVGGAEAIPTLVQGLADNMRNVRESSAIALERMAARFPRDVAGHFAELSGSSTAEVVADMLNSSDGAVRHAAVKLLGLLRDSRFAFRLLTLFDIEELREVAADALITMGKAATCSLVGIWPGADSRTRAYLAYVFGEAGCAECLEFLVTGLSSSDPELKLASVVALGKLEEVAALPHLIACLGDESEEIREAATQALSRLGSRYRQETIRSVCPLLEYDDPEMRMNGVLILGRLDSPEVERHLAFAMKDESPLVRSAAVRAFEDKTTAGQLQALMLALTDEDSEVRRLAAEALGTTGDKQALKPLELALQDEDIWVRTAAVRALGRFGGEAAGALVQNALHDPVGLVSITALETLSGMDPEKAYPLLVGALVHGDEEVVNAALQLLAADGRKDWIPPVFNQLINHHHWEVRITFVRTLAKLVGAECRSYLESRLLIEGEDLVRRQIQDLLAHFKKRQG
jgi:HEAT repeat protein